MGFVPCVIIFWAFGTLKSLLEHDMCHLPDWATCPLPTFHNVATDCSIWKTGHSKREGGDRLVGSKNLEGLKVEVYIDRRFQRTRIEGSSTVGKSTLGESAGGNFETSES
jgi:hypothetical protein